MKTFLPESLKSIEGRVKRQKESEKIDWTKRLTQFNLAKARKEKKVNKQFLLFNLSLFLF